MKYTIDGEGESNSCTIKVEDELSLNNLSQQVEESYNKTQGKGHNPGFSCLSPLIMQIVI